MPLPIPDFLKPYANKYENPNVQIEQTANQQMINQQKVGEYPEFLRQYYISGSAKLGKETTSQPTMGELGYHEQKKDFTNPIVWEQYIIKNKKIPTLGDVLQLVKLRLRKDFKANIPVYTKSGYRMESPFQKRLDKVSDAAGIALLLYATGQTLYATAGLRKMALGNLQNAMSIVKKEVGKTPTLNNIKQIYIQMRKAPAGTYSKEAIESADYLLNLRENLVVRNPTRSPKFGYSFKEMLNNYLVNLPYFGSIPLPRKLKFNKKPIITDKTSVDEFINSINPEVSNLGQKILARYTNTQRAINDPVVLDKLNIINTLIKEKEPLAVKLFGDTPLSPEEFLAHYNVVKNSQSFRNLINMVNYFQSKTAPLRIMMSKPQIAETAKQALESSLKTVLNPTDLQNLTFILFPTLQKAIEKVTSTVSNQAKQKNTVNLTLYRADTGMGKLTHVTYATGHPEIAKTYGAKVKAYKVSLPKESILHIDYKIPKNPLYDFHTVEIDGRKIDFQLITPEDQKFLLSKGYKAIDVTKIDKDGKKIPHYEFVALDKKILQPVEVLPPEIPNKATVIKPSQTFLQKYQKGTTADILGTPDYEALKEVKQSPEKTLEILKKNYAKIQKNIDTAEQMFLNNKIDALTARKKIAEQLQLIKKLKTLNPYGKNEKITQLNEKALKYAQTKLNKIKLTSKPTATHFLSKQEQEELTKKGLTNLQPNNDFVYIGIRNPETLTKILEAGKLKVDKTSEKMGIFGSHHLAIAKDYAKKTGVIFKIPYDKTADISDKIDQRLKQVRLNKDIDLSKAFVKVGNKWVKFTEYKKKTQSAKKPLVMDEETYLATHGASRFGIGEPALHKNIPYGNVRQKLIESQSKKDLELINKREQLRQEYKAKVAKGEIRPPTRVEKLLRQAQGMSELESVKAAKRLLAKMGIDWKTGQHITKPQPVAKEQVKTTEQSFKSVDVTNKLDKVAQETYNKTFNKLGSRQIKTVLEKANIDFMPISINNISKFKAKLDIAHIYMNLKPALVYGSIKQHIFTDATLLISDITLANKALQQLQNYIKKVRINYLVENEGISYKQAEQKVNKYIKDQIRKYTMPDIKSILKVESDEKPLSFIGIVYNKMRGNYYAIYTDGKEPFAFHLEHISFLHKHLGSSFIIEGRGNGFHPAHILVNNKVIGAIMPQKILQETPGLLQKITDFIKSPVEQALQKDVQIEDEAKRSGNVSLNLLKEMKSKLADFIVTANQLREKDINLWYIWREQMFKMVASVEKGINLFEKHMKGYWTPISAKDAYDMAILFDAGDKPPYTGDKLKMYNRIAELNKKLEEYKLKKKLTGKFQDADITLLDEQIAELEKKGTAKALAKANELSQLRDKISKMNYLPRKAILNKYWGASPDKREAFLKKLKNTDLLSSSYKHRKSKLLLAELVNKGVLQPEDINFIEMTAENYVETFMKETMRETYQIFEKNEMIKKASNELKLQGWVSPYKLGIKDPYLKEKLFHPALAQAFEQYIVSQKPHNWLLRILGIVKVAQFIKPNIVWFYDIAQILFRGLYSFNPIVNSKLMKKALESVKNKDDIYLHLLEKGLYPMPEGIPKKILADEYSRFARRHITDVSQFKKTLEMLAGHTITTKDKDLFDIAMEFPRMYVDPLAKVTWQGDKVMRTFGYLQAKRMGYDDEKAIRITREALGDYSVLSNKYKEVASYIFFVYAFRILMPVEMTKTLFIEPMRFLIKKVTGNDPPKGEAERILKALLGFFALVYIPYRIMKHFGFYPTGKHLGPLAWKYAKTVLYKGKKKEIVVGYNNIVNMPIKYWNRFTSYDPTNPTSPFIQVVGRVGKWEIQPLYRIAIEIITNKPSFSTKPYVYNINDPWNKQVADMTKYLFEQSFRFYATLDDLTSSKTSYAKQQQEVIDTNMKLFEKVLVNTFGYAYVRSSRDYIKQIMLTQLKAERTKRLHKIIKNYTGDKKKKEISKLNGWYNRSLQYIMKHY